MAQRRKDNREDLLTTSEAAEALGVSPTSIKRWADAGRLPALKTAGGHRRYRLVDVAEFLRSEDGADAEPMDAEEVEPRPERADAAWAGAARGGDARGEDARRRDARGDAEPRFRRRPLPTTGGTASDLAARALARRLPRMSRAEIDALPVGVIQLSDDGRVLLYSATESRFSGIARAAAESTHFFGELAPCCNNRLVHGRFKDGVASGELDVTLDYTFVYRMKPTNVRLHLYRDPQTQTNWLTVTPI
ncbi:MAG: helix-turn-helix domain-containing protein [Sandaracinaceae bacterium]